MQIFKQRLQICANRVGGRAILAKRAGISAMQLKRYMRGTSNPTLDKLEHIATASGVKASWLVGGEDNTGKSRSQVVLDRDIFLQVVESVEVVLINSGRMLTPPRKALFVFAMTKAVEQGYEKEREHLLSAKIILQMLDFMTAFEMNTDVHELYKAIENLPDEMNKNTADKWASLVTQANIHFYDTPSGKKYFEYLPEITGNYATSIDRVLEKANNITHVNSVLELGCGNGRYLKYIHEKYPDLNLKGVDTSARAGNYCRYLEEVALLPSKTFVQADMRALPYEDESFDLIISRGSLFCFPYHQAGKSPLEEVFSEIRRVLRPGGVFHGLTRAGEGLTFYHGHQLISPPLLQKMCDKTGLHPFGHAEIDVNHKIANEPQKGVHERFKDFIAFELIKPLE